MEVSHNNGEQGDRVAHAKRRRFLRGVGVGVLFLVIFGALAYRVVSRRLSSTRRDSISRTDHSATGTKTTLGQCLALLKKNESDNPSLIVQVQRLVDDAERNGLELNKAEPSLMVVSYRQHDKNVINVVVQIYQSPKAGTIEVLNPDGVVRARLGDDLFGSAENLMQLLYNRVTYLGSADDVALQQRAVQAAIEGDLTLLREQTIDPLHVVAVMPSAARFLPGSLRARVQSVVMNSELTFAEWRSQVALETDSEETAQQVGNTVAAWREIAMTLANTYAKHSSGLPLRQSLEDSTVEVKGDWVLTGAKIPSKTVVRVSKEIAGHGGAHGCSHGFYKTPAHWPSGVTQLMLGCQTYTKDQCITLLVTPVRNDASVALAQQLIAAKINRLVSLPATPQQVQAIADADNLFCSSAGGLPYHVATSSPVGQQMTSLASILDIYNNSCHAGGGGDTATGGSTVGGCNQAYYNKVEHWPSNVTKLPLGCRVYTQGQCLTLLGTVDASDVSLDLAHQLVAARLNQTVGLPASGAQLDAITAADNLFCSYPGKLPFRIPPSSPAGIQMSNLATTLNTYNNSCQGAASNQTGSGKGPKTAKGKD